MKIAFLFSGQLRDIPIDLFRNSLLNLTEDLDYGIYSYLWEESGKSLNHSKENVSKRDEINTHELFQDLFKGFNTISTKFASYKNFREGLGAKYKKIYNSKEYHFGTVNSMPQIFALSKCFQLLNEDLNNYDLVFKCRFDSLFIHPLKFYNLESIKKSNKIFSLNFGRAYYPKRVYDIFFGGSKNSMRFLLDLWDIFPNLVYDPFDNFLEKRDACRILYLAASKKGVKSESFDTRICDVFRNFENNYYEKYLLSMHLLSFKKLFKYLFLIPFFYKWFIKRNLNPYKIFLLLTKSLMIAPISYMKRIKYLK